MGAWYTGEGFYGSWLIFLIGYFIGIYYVHKKKGIKGAIILGISIAIVLIIIYILGFKR